VGRFGGSSPNVAEETDFRPQLPWGRKNQVRTRPTKGSRREGEMPVKSKGVKNLRKRGGFPCFIKKKALGAAQKNRGGRAKGARRREKQGQDGQGGGSGYDKQVVGVVSGAFEGACWGIAKVRRGGCLGLDSMVSHRAQAEKEKGRGFRLGGAGLTGKTVLTNKKKNAGRRGGGK